MQSGQGDTICAVSTAPGVGGIAVIRISGPQTNKIVNERYSRDVMAQAARTLSYGNFIDNSGEVIDEVVLSRFAAPRSFTGEDLIEISCHGSRFIQQRILEELLSSGCRMAGPGEFTQRAFLNQKMDLSQAEAVGDLIASESEAAHRMAMHQMKGGFSKKIEELKSDLLQFASLIELELDFSEEDVEFADRGAFRELLSRVKSHCAKLIASFQLGNVIKNGVPVAIIGPPNAGKSTLLNALIDEERAIVSELAGTTRDAIEASLQIQGIRFRFIDTAGLRETQDQIESQGIRIAREKANKARLIIRVEDGEELLKKEEERLYSNYLSEISWQDDERVIVVQNKVDCLSEQERKKDAIPISAKEGLGLEELKSALLNKLALDSPSEQDVIVSNARHVAALNLVLNALSAVEESMDMGNPSDLWAIDVRKALFHLGEISGDVSSDDILGHIFSNFCIGK